MKQGFRQSMAWLHGWAGLVMGWLLFAIAITGTASVFRPEISNWMRPEISAAPDAQKALVAAVEYLKKAAPDAPGWYLTAPDDRAYPVMVAYATKNEKGEDDYVQKALDPLTGRPEGIRDTLGGEFFYRFHFELQMPYPWGRYLASAAAMLMLVALISGIITHRRIFADFFTLRPGKGKRSWLDAHNVMGVLAMPFHLMITFTGILTLVTLTMPWGGVANYGDDIAAFYKEVSPGFYSRPRAERPAPLGDIEAMLNDARRRMHGGRIGYANIDNPGDANAVLEVTRNDGDQIAYAAGILAYDGVTGQLLSQYEETRPARKTYDVLYGLHIGRFAPEFSRWLYFLCGLALAATIGTGMVLWSISRTRNKGAGHVVVERLTTGAIGGMPLAVAATFWANRLLPGGMPGRQGLEVDTFFAVWGSAILFGLLRTGRRGWIELMAVTAAAWLLLPAVSALTAGRGLLSFPWRGNGLFVGFDLVALALGAIAALICIKVMRAPVMKAGRA
ncbi:PepSY domain-containing protein [Sphingobium phenoxybenzoativorans]|uniref:PepSY domain-containing protein n=1 Tax=Sphingobium phenoxybenzoativorans TaxID=1592790 RepID=A0A975K902_9SPHN|nr:PepSY-associated TM helix domain-containing protein [Sphingobium phenoxybenzoativorans]QUT06692.1 PepSY domain-containing protein [Sphingobium phenoxybenzoativorans]